MANLMILFLAGALITAGLGLGALAAIQSWRGWSSRRWPQCQGTITELTVQQTRSAAIPMARYTYEVGGQTYTGDTIEFLLSRGAVENAQRRYQPGAPARVSYNPANPQQSTLQTGVALFPLACILGGGILFIACGLWLILPP